MSEVAPAWRFWLNYCAGNISDEDLRAILAIVKMDTIVIREGGWDATRDWRETLSGGDQQKIAWARLFYHKPKVCAILFGSPCVG